MVKRNPHFSKLTPKYLFPEVERRVKTFRDIHPKTDLISLSIGDTSLPIPKEIVSDLKKAAHALGTQKNYQGYGPEAGEPKLREEIAGHFYKGKIQPDEVFVSDGAKCDIGRLQLLFGSTVSIALQDPSYPVYLDTGLLVGQEKIHLLPCHPKNQFLPSIEEIPPVDLIYFCSPNNPTGAVASSEYLSKLVKKAHQNKSVILFDAAYSEYIKDPKLPHSIYEIEGSNEVAIEISSFSKLMGFTGVRLGWTVVPHQLKYDDGSSIRNDWSRIVTTFFNGASNIAQKGGISTLAKVPSKIKNHISYYMENTRLLREALLAKGLSVHGGENAPYLWCHFKDKKSWDVFQIFLEDLQLITTPGVGFGSQGESFIRFSAFGLRANIVRACKRIAERWPTSLL